MTAMGDELLAGIVVGGLFLTIVGLGLWWWWRDLSRSQHTSYKRWHSDNDDEGSEYHGIGSHPLVNTFSSKNPQRARAIYTFKAEDDDEMDMDEGDMLLVLSEPEPKWSYVRLSDNGREGLVPTSMFELLNDENPTNIV